MVADDEELIRDALAALLNLEDDLESWQPRPTAEAPVETARAYRPDVAVADLQMPVRRPSGHSRAGQGPGVMRGGDPHWAWRPPDLQRVLRSGAKGFLQTGSPGGALADVIRRVHNGSRYVDPALAADALTAPPNP
jgi:two-component system, NarL family, response regulator DesR